MYKYLHGIDTLSLGNDYISGFAEQEQQFQVNQVHRLFFTNPLVQLERMAIIKAIIRSSNIKIYICVYFSDNGILLIII